MIIEILDLQKRPYRVQRRESKKNVALSSKISFEINRTLIVLFISQKTVILISFILGKIFRFSLEDYNKYIINFTQTILTPDILLDLNIVIPKSIAPRVPEPKYYFRNLQLNLTPDCNLRCLYCYARSGRRGETNVMSFEMAKSIIDFVSKYCGDELNLKFVGEGEPTTQFSLLKKIFYYAKKKVSKVIINPISTNGVFSKETADWLIKNAKKIQISCDGPSFLQDKYRPLANGKGSSKYVEQTIKYFVRKKKAFRVRVTMTDDFYGNELKVFNYFWQLGVKNILWGPLEIIGSAKTLPTADDKTKIRADSNLLKLFQAFKKLIELQEELQMNIAIISFTALGSTVTCGIYNKQLLTMDPDGNISACDRHTSSRDFIENPFMKKFLLGHYDNKLQKIHLDFHKLDQLIKIINHQLDVNHCLECSLLTACSTICLYALGHKYGTINPQQKSCGDVEKLSPLLIFEYFSQKYFIKKTPFLEIQNNKLYLSLVYNKFELSVSKNNHKLNKNPYIIVTDINKLQLIEQQIIKYKNNNSDLILFLLCFQIPQQELKTTSALKIKQFLSYLQNNHVYFKLTRPLPVELFNDKKEYKRICLKFNIPVLIYDSIDFYLVKNDIVYFTEKFQGTKKFSDYQDREEIYQDYLTLNLVNKK